MRIFHNKTSNHTNHSKTGRSGFTLPEVIIAMIILSMTTISSLNLIVFLSKFSLNNNNMIIATNLAREGIEIVRNQRDTNWLQWGGSLRESWNNGFDGTTNIYGLPYKSDGSNLEIMETYSTPNYDTDRFFYYLVNPVINGHHAIELWKSSATPFADKDAMFDYDSENEKHRLYYEDGVGYVHNGTTGNETNFYRVIEISYYNNSLYDTSTPDEDAARTQVDNLATNVTDANTIKVVSTVGYRHGSGWRYVSLETFMTDWYLRDSQNDDI